MRATNLGQAVVAGVLLLALRGAGGASGGAPAPVTESEVVQAAQRVGVNYRNLYEAALHHKEALPAFLALAAGDFLDGAATDGYCTDLMTMLVQHGDKVFAQAAQNFAPPVRCTILDFLYYAQPSPTAQSSFAATYPLTEALAGEARWTYLVQKGDTLEKIARQIAPDAYRETMRRIVTLNHLKSVDTLMAGATLKLP